MEYRRQNDIEVERQKWKGKNSPLLSCLLMVYGLYEKTNPIFEGAE
jgi:hypothetical protein